MSKKAKTKPEASNTRPYPSREEEQEREPAGRDCLQPADVEPSDVARWGEATWEESRWAP